DGKIFAVRLGLSGLLALFVGSISFRRISVEDELRTTASQITWGMSFGPGLGKPTFTVENFRQTNDAAEPWRGDYHFEWAVKAGDADKLKRLPLAQRREVRDLVRDGFNYLTNVEVADNASQDPAEARFVVTTRGT